MENMFYESRAFNFKSALDASWEIKNPDVYPGTSMFKDTCSLQAACGNCGKKSIYFSYPLYHTVTCPLSSAKTGTTAATVCTLCADNGNECCKTPTCDNIDGSSTPFASSSCPIGQSLKKDLSAVSCATTVCAASDCCYTPFAAADSAALKSAVESCLAETGNGLCPIYSNSHGVMGDWDISKVTSTAHLFGTKPYFNADLSNWSTEGVTSMKQSKISLRPPLLQMLLFSIVLNSFFSLFFY